MRLLYAVICEDARTHPSGRADLMGIFHQLLAPGFPALQDRLTLALAIEWDSREQGRIEFEVRLMDPDGQSILSADGHTDVEPADEAQAPPQTRLFLPIEKIAFPRAGTYEFQLVVSDRKISLVPLHIMSESSESSESS